MARPYRRDPNKAEKRAAGTAKLVLIKLRTEKARQCLEQYVSSSDEAQLVEARSRLDSVIDLCEDEAL